MWVPYILSMVLGRAFNYNDFRAGPDIFTKEIIQQGTKIIPRYITNSKCRFIESERQARDMIEAGGSFSAAVKGKAAGASVAVRGEYLSDERDRLHTIEYLCHVVYETETHTLLESAKPPRGWTSNWSSRDLGTHYVRSITYGGEVIASVSFKAKSNRDIQNVAGALKVGVTFKGITGSVGGEFAHFTDVTRESFDMKIKYYSSTPLPSVPATLTEMYGVLDTFKQQVAGVNNGLGVPVRVDLVPLNVLDASAADYLPNAAVAARLGDHEVMFNDLLTAQDELSSWGRTLPPVSDALETKLGQLSQLLSTVYNKLAEVSAGLQYDGDSTQALDEAATFYTTSGASLPYYYTTMVHNLQKEVNAAIDAA